MKKATVNRHRGPRAKLFADFRTVFFGEILVAIRAMKVHPRAEHMRIDDENFLTIWTSDFNGLTHGLPRYILDFRFWILDSLDDFDAPLSVRS